MLSRTVILEERQFRCAAHSWTVTLERTITLPDRDMVFDSPEDARQYFSEIKRTYRIIDTNWDGKQDEVQVSTGPGAHIRGFDNWAGAWKAYCAAVVGYVKFFPQLQQIPGNPSLSLRLDLPDPRKLEPFL